MSVSVETYIVISLMFAVFAAFAAVGTSVVLGAGFERLRAGFDQVRRQSGFFADAIYKLDQRTKKLDEEAAKMKSNISSMDDRVNRVEKQTTFIADAVNSIEQRILQGSPMQEPAHDIARPVQMREVASFSQTPRTDIHQWHKQPAREQQVREFQPLDDQQNLTSGLYREFPEMLTQDDGPEVGESHDSSGGLTTLLTRYFAGEGSGKGVVYH